MTMLLPDGYRFTAEVLTGSNLHINGMYVEYTNADLDLATPRTLGYYEKLKTKQFSGYARIAVHSATAHDGIATFSSVLTCDDLCGCAPAKTSKIVAATLVCMPDNNQINDRFLYLSVFPEPLPIVRGAHIGVKIQLKVG